MVDVVEIEEGEAAEGVVETEGGEVAGGVAALQGKIRGNLLIHKFISWPSWRQDSFSFCIFFCGLSKVICSTWLFKLL